MCIVISNIPAQIWEKHRKTKAHVEIHQLTVNSWHKLEKNIIDDLLMKSLQLKIGHPLG